MSLTISRQAKRNLVVRYAGQSHLNGDWKLFVGMLARSTGESRIREIFGPYGDIKEVSRPVDAKPVQHAQ